MRRPSNRGNYTFGGNLKIAVDHKVPDKALIKGWLLALFEMGQIRRGKRGNKETGTERCPLHCISGAARCRVR